MKKKDLKNQKGAISIFVLMAMLFFLVTMLGVYTITSKRAQTQTESVELVKEKYYTEGEEQVLYQQKVSNATNNLPIYTKEQLWSVGTGKKVEMEGTVYTFAAAATYELKNDIVINLDDTMKIVDTSKVNRNGYEIYYYNPENNLYYNLSDSSSYDLQKNGYYFKSR